MDYSRLKELAEGFVGRGCQKYPDELEGALRDTATTGVVRLQWDLLCPVLHNKLEKVLTSVFPVSEMDAESREMTQQLLQQLDKFRDPPFTIQRLCELLLEPKRYYKRLDYYIRAVEKNLLVVSTQESDLRWMQSPRLTSEKPSQEDVKTNGAHTQIEDPHSPKTAPEPPPTDKDSPPMAPTSTWSNLREMESQQTETAANFSSSREDKENSSSNRDLPSPLGGTSGRKRSISLRDSLQLEEDESSITVRQEADSTVNFESPPFEPPQPPLFQGVEEESPCKRLRESPAGGVGATVDREGASDNEGRMEREGFLASSSQLVSLLENKVAPGDVSEGRGEGEGDRGGDGKESGEAAGEGERAICHKDSNLEPGSSPSEQSSHSVQAVKQVSSEPIEAMDTD